MAIRSFQRNRDAPLDTKMFEWVLVAKHPQTKVDLIVWLYFVQNSFKIMKQFNRNIVCDIIYWHLNKWSLLLTKWTNKWCLAIWQLLTFGKLPDNCQADHLCSRTKICPDATMVVFSMFYHNVVEQNQLHQTSLPTLFVWSLVTVHKYL